jgi:predicted patatin/cPLA2 family phospholipase
MENLTQIKHIVLSGGGPIGFSMYSVLRESNQSGFWNISNIKTIYATSIGAILATMISLQYEWTILDDYLIYRPWHNVFKVDLYSIIHAIQQKGIFNKTAIKKMFSPLFQGKDIPMDITMKDFYERTGIELHFFSSEINYSEEIDISYHTHGEWKIIDAMYSSCSLPILFEPFIYENKCFMDGGIRNNYPLKQCIDAYPGEEESIFGIYADITNESLEKITEISTLFDYLIHIVYQCIIRENEKTKGNVSVLHEIKIPSSKNIIYDIYHSISSSEERIRLISLGVEYFKTYTENMK